MPSWETNACQKKTLSACAVTSLVLLAGLLIFVVIYLTSSRKDLVEKHSIQDPAHSLSDNMYDDCRSKAVVITDEAYMQKWDNSNNFSEAWRNAERKAKAPAHKYMEERHSVGIYMYTNLMLATARHKNFNVKMIEQSMKLYESLYSSLSEAVQVLRHSQVTCLSTTYRSDTLLNPNISGEQVRFNYFILTSDWRNSIMSTSCFEVYTCFGANITHYSALQINGQVLIPPYEVFKVTDVQTGTQRCKVIYQLKSNLNCVYDRKSNMLQPISAMSIDQFWLIFSITCMIIVSLLLPCVIVKLLKKPRNWRVLMTQAL